jgi:hypothetical protein
VSKTIILKDKSKKAHSQVIDPTNDELLKMAVNSDWALGSSKL